MMQLSRSSALIRSAVSFSFNGGRTVLFQALCILIFATHALSGHAASDRDSKVRLLVLGDSLSAAYNMNRELGWVNLLRAHYADQALSVDINNASVSGATTAAGLQMLPSALARHRPHIVVIALGGNDGLQGKPVPYIRKNIDRLVKLSLDSGARVLLLGVHLPPNYGAAYTQPFFDQYQAIAEANGVDRVPFMLEGVATHRDLMMPDGIHPKPQAQARVMANVAAKLDALVRAIHAEK